MEYRLRNATAKDTESINALFVEMINTIYDTNDAKGYEPSHFDRFFADGEDRICVAEKDNEVVAFLSIEVHRKDAYIYLDDFSVTKECRGFGIGTALLEKAEAYATRIGISRIALHVEKSNVRAYKLYKRFGYEVHQDEGTRLLLLKEIPLP